MLANCKIGQITARVSRMGHFLAQLQCQTVSPLGRDWGHSSEREKHGRRPPGPGVVAGRLVLRGPLSAPQAARTQLHCPGKCSATTAGSTT